MESNKRSSLIVKPTTTIRHDGELVKVQYNPGLMTLGRAVDLMIGGMGLYSTLLWLILGENFMALWMLMLSLSLIYEGLKRPKEEPRKLTEDERTAMELVQLESKND